MRIYTFLAGLSFMLWAGLVQAATLNFNGADVAGCSRSGSQYTCNSLSLADTDAIVIASGAAVTVNSALTITYNQGLTMNGSAALTVKGNFDMSNVNPNNLRISGGSLAAPGYTFSMGAQAQTISANISAATISMGSNNVNVTGSISATGQVSIASGSTIKGPISGDTVNILAANSQITGDITAVTAIIVGSGSQVKGNLTAPTVNLQASNLSVTGNVKALNSLTIASGNNIKGNVEGGNVTLNDSNAYITGNALVDHITLGWQGRVQQTITCKAYTPANPCSCVTNNSGYAYTDPLGPKCGAGTQAGPDHFQITHPPAALTCSPAPVTVTACADAACSTVYTGAAQVTLTPGGATAQINASTPATGIATSSVSQTTPASNVLIGLSSTPATTGALVCKSSVDNSTTNCQMAFVSSALQVSGAPRYAEQDDNTAAISISALQASSSNPNACVPLFAGQTKTITVKCSYADPSSGTLPARIRDANGNLIPLGVNAGSACSGAGAPVSLAFNANGVATPSMLYADVGTLGLSATYASTSGSDSGLTMTGSGNVIVAPKSFIFSPISTPQRSGLAVTPVSPATAIGVSALNAQGKVTANFGRESVAQAVSLKHLLVAPVFSGNNDPEVVGNLSFAGNGNGVGTASGLSWPETGTIQFTASLPTYQGAVLPATGNSANVQFVPHHFITETSGTPPMPCLSSLNCAGSPASFVYSGQPFNLRVTAQNAANATTANYDGRDSSLSAKVNLQGYDAASGTTAFPPSNPSGSQLTDGSAAQNVVTGMSPASFKAGVGIASIAYRFPGAYAVPAGATALAPPTGVLFRATTTYPNGMGVSSASVSAPAFPSGGGGVEAKLTVLTGRIMVPNSYGSERLPIRLPVQVQYWDGGWKTTTSDSVSSFTQAAVILANCSKGLASSGNACNGAVKAAQGTYTVSTGVLPLPNGQLVLLAPGLAGSVDVSVGGFPYLPSTIGRAVFGVYKSGPVIYLRELY
ncbi:DUF6701 domain-containing protein [Janthinobacterium sp. Mn2066]|uniref:DUF6701 domain-containing protein n=1 Tax=Janthinobacterium sp. Mn2066 TaxID=3395264 RepID=UPI003BD87E4E